MVRHRPDGARAQTGTKETGAVFQSVLTFGAEAGPNKLAEFAGDVAIDSDGNL